MFTSKQMIGEMMMSAAMVAVLASVASAQLRTPATQSTSIPAQGAGMGSGSGVAATLDVVLPSTSWVDLGYELAGLDGAPKFKGNGVIQAGERSKLVLQGAAPLAPAVLFVSIDSALQPFKGGTLLPATPMAFVMTTDYEGRIELSISASANLPAGIDLVMQYAVADAGAIQGVALSNALQTATH